MIQSISFENYRIFADKQHLTIAPITIVFGKNNVGKSAILRLPVLIKNLLESANNDELFEKTINGIRICEDYSDVVYRKGHRAVSLEVTDGASHVGVDFFVEAKGKPRTHAEKICGTLYDGTKIESRSQLCNIITLDIEYLKAIREYPKAGYFQLSEIENTGLAGGMFAYRRLVDDANDNSGALCSKVSEWFKKTFDGWGIEIDTSRQPIYSIELTHDGIRNNILDGGAGITQSLPIIISAATPVESPRLYIYEEPETHLHPEAHGEIAEFIAGEAVASDGLKHFLIESHSINFLLRLRTLVAGGKLKPEDLALYYVEFNQASNQSTLRRVTVNPDGSVNGWPENVFKETLVESMALRRAQIKREGGAYRQ